MHITQRAVSKQTCFEDDDDRSMFLGLLEQHAAASRCDMHAYVLMSNHIHLLLTPYAEGAPGKLMKRVLEVYSRHYNRKYARSGTLWGSRYWSCLVEDASYVTCTYRYIELNPVRAGMTPTPAHYPWSSYAVNGLGAQSAWIRPHPRYLELGHTEDKRRSAYRSFVDFGAGVNELEAIRIATRSGRPFGSPAFIERVRRECDPEPEP